MSNFAILRTEWPEALDSASKADALAYPDARTACFHARRALELMVHWLYKHDAKIKLPYQDNLSALIHEPTFKTRRVLHSSPPSSTAPSARNYDQAPH